MFVSTQRGESSEHKLSLRHCTRCPSPSGNRNAAKSRRILGRMRLRHARLPGTTAVAHAEAERSPDFDLVHGRACGGRVSLDGIDARGRGALGLRNAECQSVECELHVDRMQTVILWNANWQSVRMRIVSLRNADAQSVECECGVRSVGLWDCQSVEC
eukprot:2268213-Rhodomonas_salina.1